MKKYSMIMSWSEEDQAYIISVPELPGCMADGKTPEEAVRNAEEVIELWIESAREDGEEIPEPKFFNSVSSRICSLVLFPQTGQKPIWFFPTPLPPYFCLFFSFYNHCAFILIKHMHISKTCIFHQLYLMLKC